MSKTQRTPLGCQEFRKSLMIGRRDFVRAGMLGAAGASGLTLSELLRSEAQASQSGQASKKQNSVIILWMRGGPSHIDMWDMKPHAPAEYRGEFQPMATNVPGVQICELLPKTAGIMDKWSIIRSLHHRKEDGTASHSTGDQICFTGHPAGRNSDENVHPSIGSIVKKQQQHLNPKLPAYVMIPRMVPGTDSSYLGAANKPFETQADPATPGKFQVQNLEAPEAISFSRMGERRGLLRSLDTLRREVDNSGMMEGFDGFSQQAWEMITGPDARKAFDLDSEPAEVRERYGFMEPFKSRVRAGGGAPAWSQRVLLARRLVEAGVRLVTVDLRWWDTHEDNFYSLKNGFLPRFDKAYSALINDLDERGLLDTTMVVAWGEIGRTPKVSYSAGRDKPGRDHWPNAMAAAVAGGGIQGGRTIGTTDSKAAVPKDNPKIPQDVLATMYRHLGVNTSMPYLDHAGRPVPVLPCGQPIHELFS